MKKVICLVLAFALCLTLYGCGSGETTSAPAQPSAEMSETQAVVEAPAEETVEQPAEDEKRKEAIQVFKEYIQENGMLLGGVYVYTADTGLTDVTYYAMVNKDAVCFSLTYNLGRVSTGTVQFSNQTLFYLTGYENQQPGAYYAYQRNSSTMGETVFSLSAGAHLKPSQYTVDSELELVDIEKTENNANAEITDEFRAAASDGINTILEVFADILDESGLNLTLADFGFEQYVIDKERASSIRSEAWAVPPVEPAPVDIQINRLQNNSAGTPELFVQFTNTSDTTIDALDFYVVCYDAYGEMVKGYGRYSAYQGTYQDSPIPAGRSTPADWHWPLYGFDNAKSVKVAVIKYKLAGESAVEIPESEYVWVQ